MKTTLMTCNIFGPVMFQYRVVTQEPETLLELYEEMMEMIHDAGYEAVDVFDYEVECFGLEKVREILKKNHLACSTYITGADILSIEKKAECFLDEAEALGTRTVMTHPQKTDAMDGMSVENIHDGIERQWRGMVDLASERGMHVIFEDRPELEFGYTKAEDVRAALDHVPGLELVYDSGNMVLAGEDPVEFLKQFPDRLRHVHLKDMMQLSPDAKEGDIAADGSRWTGAPTGKGVVDLRAVVRTLKEIGYDGYVTVEFVNDADGDFRANLEKARVYVEGLL